MGRATCSSTLPVFLLLIWVSSALPQAPDVAWLRTYAGHWGRSVLQTSDGGYLVVGSTSDLGDPYGDVFLIRTDADGETLWIRTYGGAGPDQGHSVRQTSDGGFIIAGRYKEYYYTDDDVYLIRTDADGDTLWARTFGGSGDEAACSVWQTSDGGFIVGGSTNSYGAGGSDAFLIRVDEDGDTLWMRTYGGTGHDACSAVQETSDGNIIALGSTASFGPGWDAVYLIKADAGGDTLWMRTYGGDAGDYGRDIEETADRGYIILGETSSFDPFGIYLIRTDADGDTVWTRAYGETDAKAVEETDDGGYIAVGATWFPCGMEVHCANVYLVKTDPAGELEWVGEYGGADDDVAEAIQQTSDGGYILAGFTESYEGGHILLLRLEGELAGGGRLRDRGNSRFSFVITPNPSSAGVSIHYTVRRSAHLCITVHDVLGRNVRTILKKNVNTGRHAAVWDGTDGRGDYVQSGVYFCRVETAAYAETRKVILAR